MTQLVLGLDLDGVVFDYEAAVRARFAAMLGVAPQTLGRQTRWSLVESGWPIRNEDHFRVLHTAAVRDGMFATMPTIPGAAEALWQLSDAGVYIRVVTHRLGFKGVHASAAGDTVTALDANRIPYRDLTFVADKPAVGADVYLDDAPHNIANLRGAGGFAVVFDQPYNQHVDGPRARNWDEVVEIVGNYAVDHGLAWDPSAVSKPRPVPVPAA